MKKVFFVMIITLLICMSCVIDSVRCVNIINRTNDAMLICYARYNNIDSVKYYIGMEGIEYQLKLDEIGKIVLYNHNHPLYKDSSLGIVLPDSSAMYCEFGGFPISANRFFNNNKGKKGYFFIINIETVQNYTWEEIRKSELYELIIVTKEMLRENDWEIYYSH